MRLMRREVYSFEPLGCEDIFIKGRWQDFFDRSTGMR
jgi:hypothetical protein